MKRVSEAADTPFETFKRHGLTGPYRDSDPFSATRTRTSGVTWHPLNPTNCSSFKFVTVSIVKPTKPPSAPRAPQTRRHRSQNAERWIERTSPLVPISAMSLPNSVGSSAQPTSRNTDPRSSTLLGHLPQIHGCLPQIRGCLPQIRGCLPKSAAASSKSVASTIPSDTVELAVLLYKVALRNWRADTANPQNRKTLEDSAIAIRRVILGYHTLLDDDGRDVVAEFLNPLVASN
ncbi:hypothetical protein FA13DRAFT_1710452 [Coprinellus micaceus]|uniref:Uncharacterized protein n=1 Tax=Coprinellus micaceus TaxID=71717 RepID=A0A4Y7T8L0_COPMI|nr:hypothetical protein FA13DRAFT_1710452 [Coprinellus micaceus]